MNHEKIGLVLSGGGSKGAYHVGVLKALNELDVPVHAVAGASIGALNGAVIASSPSLAEAEQKLREIWTSMGSNDPIQFNLPSYLKVLTQSGLQINGIESLYRASLASQSAVLKSLSVLPLAYRAPISFYLNDWFETKNKQLEGLLSHEPVKNLLNQYIDLDHLNQGLPLYVSVFPSSSPWLDVVQAVLSEIGFTDTKPSHFYHLQNLDESEQLKLILASASIPVAFPPINIQGQDYQDGGLGGWHKAQGNTPIEPLLQDGYRHIIVTHLGDGSFWSRRDFPDANIIEIRPQKAITRNGMLSDLMGFDDDCINSWMEQGYEDTKHCVGKVKASLQAVHQLECNKKILNNSELLAVNSQKKMNDAMLRLLD